MIKEKIILERKEIWTDYQTVLAQNYNVIAIDLLGHGETGCLGYIHTMNEMANMVFAVLKHEKFRKSFIVGHSMGGYVALAFGELFPDNTSGICLFNSTAKDYSETKKEDRLRAIKVVKKNHELPRAFLQRFSKIKNKKIKLSSLAGMLLLIEVLENENLLHILNSYAVKSKGKPFFENQKLFHAIMVKLVDTQA